VHSLIQSTLVILVFMFVSIETIFAMFSSCITLDVSVRRRQLTLTADIIKILKYSIYVKHGITYISEKSLAQYLWSIRYLFYSFLFLIFKCKYFIFGQSRRHDTNVCLPISWYHHVFIIVIQ
jgi:hypothetical protein